MASRITLWTCIRPASSPRTDFLGRTAAPLQRRASFGTRKGRCSALILRVILSEPSGLVMR
ncbi:MAG: hypothetical protein E5X58_35035 [Mesorhizobium sp.]|nr:MAG: hypothetical protein E5X58_35035 [Mesorhizobium sp.]